MSACWTIDVMHLATIPRLPLTRFVPDAAPEALIDAPCFGYLLTSPGLTVVVDTGPAIEGNSSVVSVTGGEPPEVMRHALLRRERRESDVRFVVHTHLHYDHMQNDDPFVNAQVVVQAMERDFALERDSFEFYRGIAGFIEQLGDRLYSVSGDTELAAGVRLVRSRGHAPGHQVVAVETTFGTVCIAGDVVPLAETRTLSALPRLMPRDDAVSRADRRGEVARAAGSRSVVPADLRPRPTVGKSGRTRKRSSTITGARSHRLSWANRSHEVETPSPRVRV